MPDINRVGDPNSAGADVTSSLQTGIRINGQNVAVDGSPVASHGIGVHASPNTANGVEAFTINGLPVNINGDADTCGHTRSASVNFRITE